MHIKDWKKEVFTIPNLLSLFRLALIPVYIYIYLGATETYQSPGASIWSPRWEKSSTRWRIRSPSSP